MTFRAIVAFSLALLLAGGGCAVGGDLLGGREKCWSDSERRLAALFRGTLELDLVGSTLATPEGDQLRLSFAGLAVRNNEAGTLAIVDASGTTLAADGDDVTLFGGMGPDEMFLVCAIEEHHGG